MADASANLSLTHMNESAHTFQKKQHLYQRNSSGNRKKIWRICRERLAVFNSSWEKLNGECKWGAIIPVNATIEHQGEGVCMCVCGNMRQQERESEREGTVKLWKMIFTHPALFSVFWNFFLTLTFCVYSCCAMYRLRNVLLCVCLCLFVSKETKAPCPFNGCILQRMTHPSEDLKARLRLPFSLLVLKFIF